MKYFLILSFIFLSACTAEPVPVDVTRKVGTAVATPTHTLSPPTAIPNEPSPTMTATAVPPTSLPTVTPSPALTPTPIPPPAPIYPLQTDQVLLFARDNELWRSDVHGVRMEQLTTANFLGWNPEEPDYRDRRPHISPNGRYIAQLSSHNTTRVLDLATGNEITLPGAWEVAWSPDSHTLAYASNGIKIVDVVTGIRQELASLPGNGRVYNMVWSPDGTKLSYDCCFTSREPYDGFYDGEIRVIDLTTGSNGMVAATQSGIASSAPDFCWAENGQITMDIANWMPVCSLNFPFDTWPKLSKDNLEAQWNAHMTADGTWLNTRLTVTNRATDQPAWGHTFDVQSMPVLDWSPDGRYLFFDDQSADSPIWRLSADGEEVVEIIPAAQFIGIVPRWEALFTPLTVSPDGHWLVTSQSSEPMPPEEDEKEQFPDGKYHVAMQVARTDGSIVWTAVDEWRPYGLGWTHPRPIKWSNDGRYLFFSNVPSPDGCGTTVNGGDVWRLDLSSGQLTEMTPFIGLVMDVSPDGTQLAVDAAYGRGFLIRHLETGAEQPIPLPDPGYNWDIGSLQWAPGGQHLLLTQVLNPCSLEPRTTAVVRVDTDTLTATTILPANDHNFTLLKWESDGEVRLLDDEGHIWYLEVFSGELAGGY